MSLQQHKEQNVLRKKKIRTALVLLCLLVKKLCFLDGCLKRHENSSDSEKPPC